MALRKLISALCATLICAGSVALELPLDAEPPFKLYSVAEGLNQKTVLAVAQDQDGFLWIATFGGLNRFDGRHFDSFTTREGLRQNLIQALLVDDRNRIWAGDAAGGLTLIEDGRVVRIFEPDEEGRGVARAILQVGSTLYVGTQPGGLRQLDLANLDAGLTRIEGAPNEIIVLVRGRNGLIYVLSSDGLYHFDEGGSGFELILEGASALSSDANGNIVVGNIDGRVGQLRQDSGIDWFEQQFSDRVTGLIQRDGEIRWVFVTSVGILPFANPDAAPLLQRSGGASAIYDQEGVLWIPIRGGLARYLGSRFEHYGLEIDGNKPEVFSILPDDSEGVWFGTSQGLIYLAADGTLSNRSDALSIPRREVRDVVMSPDGKTLWVAHVQNPTYGIDLESQTITKTLGSENSITVSALTDSQGRLWTGSYLGALDRYDPVADETRTYELGNGAAIYAMDLAADGTLWFAANYQGLFRLDTTDPAAEPVQVIAHEILQQEFFTQLVVEGVGDAAVVWLAGIEGNLLRIENGVASQVFNEPVLSDHTIYAIQPLPDNTIVLATSRGAYRYDTILEELDHYTALDGFVAIEAKVHATYFDGGDNLLIGTTSGVTKMDISVPMAGVPVPKPLITSRTIGDVVVRPTDAVPEEPLSGEVRIDFTAVSTLKPDAIEYSYRLNGQDADWSRATLTTSISYSNLNPGDYAFEVRARLAGGQWSLPASWSFVVPTPFWRTPWFMALAALVMTTIVWSIVQLRLRSVARINERLRAEVAERTESIEAGRRALEEINAQLSSEILERQKVDELRAEIEARFQQAYHNSPVGMALVNTEGLVYDANPKMRALFWPHSREHDKESLLDIVAKQDREQFEAFLNACALDQAKQTSMECACVAHDGATLHIDFHPSAVRDQHGELKYLVVLANDVTDSRAMTDQLAYQARFDELTGLSNRRAFAEKLKGVGDRVDAGASAFLMFLDLDQFKVVNDTCGHAAGDELLRNVSGVIISSVRDEDIVARLGGDEFALILVGCDESAAMQRAEVIRQRIQDLEFLWQQEVFRIGVSIGVVPIVGRSQNLNELQQLADAACYAAKEAGRNRVHLVSDSEDAAHEHRGEMRWVQRLNHAIDSDSFVLYGQRILPLGGRCDRTERIEILLRMRDRENGRLIPPGAFLPAAERYGLQGRLDLWVVRNVIDALHGQNVDELARRQFWINLSGASIGDDKVADALIDMVHAAGLPEGCLNFEITETAIIRKIADAKRLISALQEMGCRFALDDFGSGLSSFGYLKQLNVDCLKIDGQFVRDITTDPTDRIFVKSIIDIAHTMNMRIVSEFVENHEVLETVQSMGSDYAQGFGIHRPEPLESMVSMTTAMRVAGLD
ncbi:MAG: EAL domain-containing protein [Pseudomonadota bacterium]